MKAVKSNCALNDLFRFNAANASSEGGAVESCVTPGYYYASGRTGILQGSCTDCAGNYCGESQDCESSQSNTYCMSYTCKQCYN